MPTRAAAKREAASLEQNLSAASLSSPAMPLAGQDKDGQRVPIKSSALPNSPNGIAFGGALPSATPNSGAKKRKRATRKTTAEPVSGGWEILPHGLGKKGDLVDAKSIDDVVSNEIQLAPASKRARPGSETKTANDVVLGARSDEVKLEEQANDTNIARFLSKIDGAQKLDDQKSVPGSPLRRGRARAKKAVKAEGEDDDMKDEYFEENKANNKRATCKKKVVNASKDVLEKVDELIDVSGNVPKKDRRKKHKYGLTPGSSPFPDHAMPTPEASEEVNRLLSELHGEVEQPKVIQPPSMNVTGCGEVPDLLDAILRTKLSASTTANNANLSLKGLKDTFGLRTSGVGKGSVNWEAVHEADLSTIIDSIKSGGLAKTKGTDIKKILAMVYERNCARRDELLKEKKTGKPADVLGANHETQKQKDAELARYEETLLSMDHVFEMTTDEAMEEMTKLPGIGVKTASCVILFCMKRPSFAVDTHVWRHCKWLGWVPEKATRDQTFSHCEVRIPDHLKYSLHQLFLRHGKTCGRCRANTSAGTKEWDETVCPIEHLVSRKEARKLHGESPGKNAKSSNLFKKTKTASGKKRTKAKRGQKLGDDETESEVEVEDVDMTEESDGVGVDWENDQST